MNYKHQGQGCPTYRGYKMESLIKLVQEVINGLDNKLERFVIVDDMHIHDTQSGLKFHMYDVPKPFYITMHETGEEVAHMRDFMDFPTTLDVFTTLRDKLMEVYEGIAEAKRNNLVEIFNTIPTE